MKLFIVTSLAAATMSAACAQTVYRCGNTYSQAACPEARAVEVSDTRSASQEAEARRVAADERRLAADMRRDRLADERAASMTHGAASLSGRAPTKLVLVELHRKKKRAAPGPLRTTDFVAYDPSSRKRRND